MTRRVPRSMEEHSPQRLAALVRRIDRLAGDGDEWERRPVTRPLAYLAPTRHCKGVVYTTKFAPVMDALTADGSSRLAIFGRYGLFDRAYAGCVAHVAKRAGRVVCFLGDLDPLDLTVFLTLREALASEKVAVRYCGVGDRWLEMCATVGRSSDGPAEIRMPLSDFEASHMRVLDTSGVDWDGVVGDQAMRLLRAGYKIELEGAVNSEIYGDGLRNSAIQLIRRLGNRR